MQEHNPEPRNPLGMDGIEFVEYATSQPQALGAVLQMMGFVPVARHRVRDVQEQSRVSGHERRPRPLALDGIAGAKQLLELRRQLVRHVRRGV